MEPDFKTLAEAWVANDQRLAQVDVERREALVGRLAEALARRRGFQKQEQTSQALIVEVDRDQLQTGLSPKALDQLTEFVQQRIDFDQEG